MCSEKSLNKKFGVRYFFTMCANNSDYKGQTKLLRLYLDCVCYGSSEFVKDKCICTTYSGMVLQASSVQLFSTEMVLESQDPFVLLDLCCLQ